MSNLTTNVLEIYGEEADLARFRGELTRRQDGLQEFDLNGLVPPSLEGPLAAWGTPSGAFNVEIHAPDKRPLEIIFESENVPPHVLIRRISALFPKLVFALRFLDECCCYVGWAVFADGEWQVGSLNKDVYRAGDRRFDQEAWEAERLDSETVTIDGYEAVDWADRFFKALKVVPQGIAEQLGLAEDAANHAELADRVEDLPPEYEHATTPLGRKRLPLELLCESASLLEARAQCRLAVRRVIESRSSVQEGVL